MIMESKCPHCGTEAIEFGTPEYDWYSDRECICNWDARCENDHRFIISEVLTTTSRLVAKDSDDLDRLIEEEDKEAKQ